MPGRPCWHSDTTHGASCPSGSDAFHLGGDSAVASSSTVLHAITLPEVEPSDTVNPLLDLEAPMISLSWADRVEQEEAEEADRAATPADVPPDSSTGGQGLAPMSPDLFADL